MSKLLRIVYLLCALPLMSYAQTSTTSDNITARQRLQLRNRQLDSIVLSVGVSSTDRMLPSARAVYNTITAWPLSGDLSGTLSAPVVVGLRGRPLSATAPTTGQVLSWNGTAWVPVTPTTGSGYQNLKDEGAALAQRGTANFLQTGNINFTLSDVPANSETEIRATVRQNSLTDFEIAPDAITREELSDEAVGTDEIEPGSVTADRLNDMGAATGQVLKWNGTAWAPAADGGTTYTGGTGINITGTVISNTGDLSNTNELQTLSVASNTATLSNSGGSVTIAGAGINTVSTSGSTITVTATEVDGSITNEIELPNQTGNAGRYLTTNGTTPSWGTISGTGTVTSVGLSLPGQFSVSGSPVTTSGTLTAAWANQSPNLVFAGPASGGAAVPGFRGLVGADFSGIGIANRGAFFNASNALTADNYFLYNSSRQQMSLGGTVTTGNHRFEISHPSNGYRIRMNHNEIFWTGPGFANMLIRNVFGGVKGLYVLDASCCDTLNAPQTPFFAFNHSFGGTDVNRSYYQFVAPTIRLTTGAASGRVLQSDANGVGSWVTQWSTSGNYLQATANSIQVFGVATIPTAVFYNNNSFTSGGSNSNDNIVLQNQNNTDGNMSSVIFNSSAGAITSGIYSKTTSHASANGELYFNTRESGNWQTRMILRNNTYLQKLSVSPNGDFSGPATINARGSGGTSGTYSLICTNSGGNTTTATIAARDDGQVGVGTNAPTEILDVNGTFRVRNLNATAIDLAGADANGKFGRVTLSGLSLTSGTLTANNFANSNLTLSASRTHNFGNNNVTFDASGASITNSTLLIFKGKADGTNSTQFITVQNVAGNPLFSGTTTNTTTTLEVAAGSKLRAGAGALYTAFTDEGSIELHQRSTDASSAQAGEIWWNNTSERLRIRNSAQAESITTYETDIKGSEAFITASSSVLQGSQRFVQADANTNSITLTAGSALIEGQIYTIRCRRNNVNPITINADTGAGFSLGIDGDSALTPSSYTCTNYEIIYLRRFGSVILVDK